jgi:hypothetical protein
MDEKHEKVTVKIGPMVYEVVEEKGLTTFDGDKKLSGHIIYDSRQIRIEAQLSEQSKRQILWHEILHGILTQAGIELEDVEKSVDVLAFGIMGVLQDNQWLTK